MRIVSLTLIAISAVCAQSRENQPRVFILDAKVLREQKAHPSSTLLNAVRSAADKVMNQGPYSVMDKNRAPTSGDKHDYMSQAPYFWRNPATPNGLPYVRRDGERNPEILGITDHSEMDRVDSMSQALALAYYFTGDEKYAERAALLLRSWFLNPDTRMNPNLTFAQAVPGVNDGRGIGIIESRSLTKTVDAVGLLAGSPAWSDADQKGMEEWLSKFLAWLRESPHGRDESRAENNHGTFYDVQVADFALFVGDAELARKTVTTAESKRIAVQIERDGKQPKELDRTKGMSYSVMNLGGLMLLATLGDRAGVDLWHFQTHDGRSIRGALDWLMPYLTGKKWPYQQIDEYKGSDMIPWLLRATAAYGDRNYEEVADQLGKPSDELESLLLRAAIARSMSR